MSNSPPFILLSVQLSPLGDLDGELEGELLGDLDGLVEGELRGLALGETLGLVLGLDVGSLVAPVSDGEREGDIVGTLVGAQSQNPQGLTPLTQMVAEVMHHFLPSVVPALVHSLYFTPPKVNGKAHAVPSGARVVSVVAQYAAHGGPKSSHLGCVACW